MNDSCPQQRQKHCRPTSSLPAVRSLKRLAPHVIYAKLECSSPNRRNVTIGINSLWVLTDPAAAQGGSLRKIRRLEDKSCNSVTSIASHEGSCSCGVNHEHGNYGARHEAVTTQTIVSTGIWAKRPKESAAAVRNDLTFWRIHPPFHH